MLFHPILGEATVFSTESQACQECHDGRKAIEVPDNTSITGRRPLVAIPLQPYAQGVHAGLQCRDCHNRITSVQPPHQSEPPKKIDCATCHENLVKEGTTPSAAQAAVLRATERYRLSFHARPNPDDPTIPNATCHDCHDSHFFNVPTDKQSQAYADWRLMNPQLCGKCHEDQLEKYADSIHGIELLNKKNIKSANCTDCHDSYAIIGAHSAKYKQQSQEICGSCHQKSLSTYYRFYHGQINRLGNLTTAKCFNCHESHNILPVKNPKSMVHPNNRLKTCQKCHDGKLRPLATQGFASFTPHAKADDYEHHPQLMLASRFMRGLLWSVFAFFLCHSGLWYYRERLERQNTSAGLVIEPVGHVRRFARLWRSAHLLFALTVMTLLLTGLTLYNAHTSWAPVVARFLGGSVTMGQIHRIAALSLVTIFVIHLVYLVQRLVRDKNFAWFGPDSLLPNKKDFLDCRDMFYWFFGKGKKPHFDRWTYYEKFDYWAVFWGIMIVGCSGMVLAFPHVAGEYFGGWIFNVALLVHGEEAFLAAVFLFTVHFFNNHFRPDKQPPPDIVMFTGTQSLQEMRRDHPAQLERLLVSGDLERHLVKPPSIVTTLSAKLLGWVLILFGLTLLFLAVS
ncbi:MAG: cytochrome c3 family protein [Magnetococcales bacterium]|nr:cytochrome c3 family protein [Magnetococcales bacterium]